MTQHKCVSCFTMNSQEYTFFFLSKSSKEGQREGKWEGSRKRERKKGRRGTLIIEAI